MGCVRQAINKAISGLSLGKGKVKSLGGFFFVRAENQEQALMLRPQMESIAGKWILPTALIVVGILRYQRVGMRRTPLVIQQEPKGSYTAKYDHGKPSLEHGGVNSNTPNVSLGGGKVKSSPPFLGKIRKIP